MMTEQFLDKDHPDAHLGMEKQRAEDYLYKDVEIVECPVCHGYGKWHLALNKYGDGQHFDAGCSQCNGWGWVQKDSPDATCVHEMRELSQEECRELDIRHWGACWHVQKCTKCGHVSAYDSSD